MKATKVTILWAGGWDDLEIDLDHQRSLTQPEHDNRTHDPAIGDWDWLRCSFLKGEMRDGNTAVKVIRRLGHGD